MDRPDVFAQYPDEEELNGTEEVNPDQQRGEAELELVPEHQLRHEVPDSHEQAYDRNHEAGHGCEPKRDLRMIGDPEHRHVIQTEEVVLRPTAAAGRLKIRDFSALIAEVADEATEVR